MGRQEWGSGENLEPGRGFPGPGGSGFSPSAFPDWSPLLPVYSWSRAELLPDLALGFPRGEGEVRKTEAARSERASAGRRGTETETRRTAPAHTRALCLYGQCVGIVAGLCGVDEDPAAVGRACFRMSIAPALPNRADRTRMTFVIRLGLRVPAAL